MRERYTDIIDPKLKEVEPTEFNLAVQEDGVAVGDGVETLNFAGSVSVSLDGSIATVQIAGGNGSLEVLDEGVTVAAAATDINFVGAGVTATANAGLVTVTIPGGSSSLAVLDEGSQLTASATSINFTGSGVTATNSGSAVTVAVATSSGIDVTEGNITVTGATALAFTGIATVTDNGSTATVNVPEGIQLDDPNSWTANQRVTTVNLGVNAGQVVLDAATSNYFALTMTGAAELQDPTNLVPGVGFKIEIKQLNVGGPFDLTYASAYRFQGTAPSLSTGANAVDVLTCVSFDGTTLRCRLEKGW